MIPLRPLALLLADFLTGCHAYAQQYDTIAKEDTISAVSIVSTYRGRDLRSTAPEYSLGMDDFSKLGVTDIGSALHKLPGVTLRDYGGAGGMKTVSVRGFGTRHTSVVYDGVSLSNCQSGEIDLSRYSIDNVAGLSLIVGDNEDIFQPVRNVASAAVLNIRTRRLPTDDLRTRLTAQLRTGSWGYVSPFLRIEKNISPKLSINAAGEYTYADNDYPYTLTNGIEKTHGRRQNSRMKSGHGELNIAYSPDSHNRLAMKLYYYDNSRQLPGLVHHQVNDSKETLREQNAVAQMGWRALLTEKLRLAYIAKFSYAMSDYKDPAYTGGIMDHRYYQREVYTSVCLLYTPAEKWAFDYSADYSFSNFTGSDVEMYRNPLRHTVLQSMTGKFSSGRLTATARLIHSLYYNGASAGESAPDINHLSPSVSLNLRLLPREELFLRLSYKDIFRSPTFNELYYKHYGSTTLKPENTSQTNLGITWYRQYGHGSEFSITADGYFNSVTDKIVAVPRNMFLWTNINMGRVRTLGADITASVTHRLNRLHTLTFTGNYTAQSVRNRSDKSSPYYNLQIAYTPEYTGSVSMAWENPWTNLSVNGTMVTERWATNEHLPTTMLDGYSDWSATAWRDISLGKGMIRLQLDVKNIFDKQYDVVRWYPMPGRSWKFAVRYTL
ncbi:MAG: TonB-dependent receptor [Bacteroidales bacterium]|nr:TonB-dependent receptor [Bacteroidales bacterium]MCM1146486.1 TonB-dependent receptor [Bacteroidales bacterium]MCM1205076.1 TonB-dependent receptor [Bacillota bacterium]MCM1509322.1 TonB-dependent receptor [Clostridium sp.]